MIETLEVASNQRSVAVLTAQIWLDKGKVAPLARDVLLSALCLAGVAQAGRAADL
jgi:hypothetical protein